jgi:hypothetical protein
MSSSCIPIWESVRRDLPVSYCTIHQFIFSFGLCPGGAERLIVDAALALQHHKHQVHLCTSHHDVSHCFRETVDGSLKISVYGDWLPRSLFGKGHVLCAWIRNIYLALTIILGILLGHWHPDIFFVDQISIAIPLLKLTNRKVGSEPTNPDTTFPGFINVS